MTLGIHEDCRVVYLAQPSGASLGIVQDTSWNPKDVSTSILKESRWNLNGCSSSCSRKFAEDSRKETLRVDKECSLRNLVSMIGQPRKDDENRRDTVVGVRYSLLEKIRVEMAAAAAGMYVTQYIRWKSLEGAPAGAKPRGQVPVHVSPPPQVQTPATAVRDENQISDEEAESLRPPPEPPCDPDEPRPNAPFQFAGPRPAAGHGGAK